MSSDSTSKTIVVAVLLCLVCSVLVSTAAVMLRPLKAKNERLDIQKNLLLAAGLLDNPKASEPVIKERYKRVEAQVVNFSTGEVVQGMDASSYDQKKAASDAKMSVSIPAGEDVGGIKTRAKFGKVFKIIENGEVAQIVLPIKGKGLWSTLYGFLALAPDTRTVLGIGFYQHGETPGLGGEIENPKWQATWKGKLALNDQFVPQIDIIKGSVDSTTPGADHKIDGLTGATITSNGVEGMINYWLGSHAYGKYLEKFRKTGGL